MKSAISRYVLCFVLALLTTASVAAKKFEPLTVIVKASPEAVKAATVSQAVSEGYAIEQEGQFQIVFQKNMTGVGGFFTSVLLSPTACSNFSPRWIFTVLFVPGPGGVTVTTHTEQEHADTLCRPARQNWDKESLRRVTTFLELIQAKAEQMQQSTAAKPEIPPTAPVPAQEIVAPAAPAAVPASQVTGLQQPAPAPIQTSVTSMPAVPEDLSLGEAARRARAKKAKQQSDAVTKKEE